MPYTFELTFTGLCVFTFAGNKRTPTEVNALLVNATHHTGDHKHLPFLAYNPRNLERTPTPAKHRLVPGADGSQIALQDLTGRALQITAPAPARPLTAEWRPTTVPHLPLRPDRNDPSQEKWLDWAMALQRMNKDTPDPNTTAGPPFMGLKGVNVTARLRITEGKLEARGFPRQPDLNYGVWDFKVPPSGPGEASHAMASSIVLTLHNVQDRQPVVLSGTGFSVALQQFKLPDGNLENLVRASITNLPEEPTPAGAPEHLSHFEHFYDLVPPPPPPPALRLPHPRPEFITSDNSFCPPTTHTKAE